MLDAFKKKGLRGLFIQDEPAAEQDASPAPVQQQAQPAQQFGNGFQGQPVGQQFGIPQQPVPYQVQPFQPAAAIDPKYWEIFDQAVNAEDLQGPDYLEFKKSIKALENLPLSEQQKYAAAFATLVASGLSVDKIKSSAQHYIGVVQREQKLFVNEMLDMENEKITKPLEQVELSKAEIERINLEIQERYNKIQEIGASINATLGEVEASKQQIAQIDKTFNYTADQYIQSINSDLTKVDQYISPSVTTPQQ